MCLVFPPQLPRKIVAFAVSASVKDKWKVKNVEGNMLSNLGGNLSTVKSSLQVQVSWGKALQYCSTFLCFITLYRDLYACEMTRYKQGHGSYLPGIIYHPRSQ